MYDEARLYEDLVSGPNQPRVPSEATAAAQLEAARGRQRALRTVVDALMQEAAPTLQPAIDGVVVFTQDDATQ